MACKLVFLDEECVAEARRICALPTGEGAPRRCTFSRVRSRHVASSRYLADDSAVVDDLLMSTYGMRRTCRLLRHVVLRGDSVLDREAIECGSHMVLICVSGTVAVAGDAVRFGRCVMEPGTMFLVESVRSAIIVGNPACEMLVVFADHMNPLPQPLLPDEALFTRDLALVDYSPSRAVVFRVECDADGAATIYVKGHIVRVLGVRAEHREPVGDDCDCCLSDAAVLSLDRTKLLSSARTVPTLQSDTLHLHLKDKGWFCAKVVAKGECDPGVFRLALASVRLLAGYLRGVVGRCGESSFYYGVVPRCEAAEWA
ncbi:hypothetical protein [Equine parapoxvirus]|nr:hypothetical protein [Equine parapoxvirus]